MCTNNPTPGGLTCTHTPGAHLYLQPEPIPTWTITPVSRAAATETSNFIQCARRELFPSLIGSPPWDLTHFTEAYITGEGHFLVAHDQGHLIAGLGYLPYDHRFPHLGLDDRKTVEIVRLFVTPKYRRFGLAAEMFAALRKHAIEAGVECLYLHTHPFLPGAIRFWERQEFHIVDVESDPSWQTTHMRLALTPG
ncbi:acetyltransferase-like protein [Penicillium brevicompactum]